MRLDLMLSASPPPVADRPAADGDAAAPRPYAHRQRREPEGHDELRAEDKDEERDGKEEGCRS